jgi:hypothetical protein
MLRRPSIAGQPLLEADSSADPHPGCPALSGKGAIDLRDRVDLANRLNSRLAWRHRGEAPARSSHDAAQLLAEELDLLLSLAAPIDQRQRDQFLHEVAAELEAGGQSGAVGIGSVHRVARAVQRRFFDPPQSPNAGKAARA